VTLLRPANGLAGVSANGVQEPARLVDVHDRKYRRPWVSQASTVSRYVLVPATL
jgi:hypothetical protein